MADNYNGHVFIIYQWLQHVSNPVANICEMLVIFAIWFCFTFFFVLSVCFLSFSFFYFLQMSEQFNQEISLTGKIPSGLFNSMFEFSGYWQKDAANTKMLAFDGVFISLYSVALEKSQMVLRDRSRYWFRYNT